MCSGAIFGFTLGTHVYFFLLHFKFVKSNTIQPKSTGRGASQNIFTQDNVTLDTVTALHFKRVTVPYTPFCEPDG